MKLEGLLRHLGIGTHLFEPCIKVKWIRRAEHYPAEVRVPDVEHIIPLNRHDSGRDSKDRRIAIDDPLSAVFLSCRYWDWQIPAGGLGQCQVHQ